VRALVAAVVLTTACSGREVWTAKPTAPCPGLDVLTAEPVSTVHPSTVPPQPKGEGSYVLEVGPAQPPVILAESWRFDRTREFVALSRGETCDIFQIRSGQSLGSASTWPDGSEPCVTWDEGLVISVGPDGLVRGEADPLVATRPDGQAIARVNLETRTIDVCYALDDRLRPRIRMGAEQDSGEDWEEYWGPIRSVALAWSRYVLLAIVELPAFEREVWVDGRLLPSYQIASWRGFETTVQPWTINWEELDPVHRDRFWAHQSPSVFVLDPDGRWMIAHIALLDKHHPDAGRIWTIPLARESSGFNYAWNVSPHIDIAHEGWTQSNGSVLHWISTKSWSNPSWVRVEAHALELGPLPGHASALLFQADYPPREFDVRVLDASSDRIDVAWRACWDHAKGPADMWLDADGCLEHASERLLDPPSKVARPPSEWTVDIERMIITRLSDGLELWYRSSGVLTSNGCLDGKAAAFADLNLRAPERLDLGSFAPTDVEAAIRCPNLLERFLAGEPIEGPRVLDSGVVVAVTHTAD
jgi:hypothetical protein